MIFRVEEGDLLKVSDEYRIAHCMSADLAVNMGIVTKINKKYELSEKLREAAPMRPVKFPDCIFTEPVFNLITKNKRSDKPTLDTVTEALCAMRRIAEEREIAKIAMPTIGCGLDRLEWEDVEQRIRQVFGTSDIEILVRVLPKKPRAKTKSEQK